MTEKLRSFGNNFLFQIVSALVAAVSAEAQYFGGYASAYSGLVGGYPYAGLAGGYPYTTAYSGYPYSAGLGYNLAGVPFGSSTGLDALTQGVDPVTQGYAYYGKRSADAEPEAKADAAYLYGGYYGYPYAYGGYFGYPGYVYGK